MPCKIRVLDELTINKIAAGEVIENPASVVKELVENALDAGAREICVEITCGGRQLIRVTDDGSGMNRDDAVLALERYATSKIRQVDDLQELSTMGFRGEALPSIAAVSKLTLLTAEKDGTATLIVVEGGRVIKCCDAARSVGTTLEVKSLFFNVPVRRKFQKAPARDIHDILKAVTLLALANPEVRFELVSDQQPLLVAPTTTGSTQAQLTQRIAATLGADFLADTVPLTVSDATGSIQGVISQPAKSRANRTAQYLFINRRAVTSPFVSQAVREAYGTSLPAQRYPAFVLHLTVAGDLVDVNVHPQKREVRLRQEQELRTLIGRGVDTALHTARPQREARPLEEWTAPTPMLQPILVTPKAPPVVAETFFTAAKPRPNVMLTLPGYFLLDPTTCRDLPVSGDGLCLVDQHAAHHRILYDRLAGQSPAPTEVQSLLIPQVIELNTLEMTLIRGVLPELRRLGIHLEEFGPTSLALHGIPSELAGVNIRDLITDLAKELRDYQSSHTISSELQKKIALKTSRAALSRHRCLSRDEADQIIGQLFQCENPYRCPLGRAVIVCLDRETLAKQFQT